MTAPEQEVTSVCVLLSASVCVRFVFKHSTLVPEVMFIEHLLFGASRNMHSLLGDATWCSHFKRQRAHL